MTGMLTGRTALVIGDGPALEALTERIRARGGQVITVATDLSNPVSMRRLIEQTLGAFGRLDVVVWLCADGTALGNGETSVL